MTDLFDEALEARERLDQRLQAIASQADAGLLFPSEAREQQREAIQEFQALLDGLRLQLEQIAAEAPELSGLIDELVRKLDRIPRAVPTEGQTFFEGLREGARATVVELGNLGRAGVQFGTQLIGGLGQAFSAFFTETEEGFRQTVANVLKGLAQILLQVAFLRALGFLFPGANVDQGTQAILQSGNPFNLGGLVRGPGRAVAAVARRMAPVAAAMALVAAPALARGQGLSQAQEAEVHRIAALGPTGPQYPATKPDGTQETAKEMVRRLGRERAERERLARELAAARGLGGEESFRALAERLARLAASEGGAALVHEIAAEVGQLDPSTLRPSPAGRYAGAAARGAGRAYEVVGRAGVKALVVLGSLGLLGDDVQVAEPHAFGGFAGGGVPRFVDTTSGFVPGTRGPNRDSVLSYLTIGEAVIQRPSVDYYGERLMAAINARLIPRDLLWPLLEGLPASLGRATHAYNEGGFAGQPSPARADTSRRSGSSGSSSGVLPILPLDETTLERLLAAGPNALQRHLRNNRGETRSSLGIDSSTR